MELELQEDVGVSPQVSGLQPLHLRGLGEKSFPPGKSQAPLGLSTTQTGRSLAQAPRVPEGRLLCPTAWARGLGLPAELDVTLCASTATLGFGRIPSLFVLQTPTYSLKLGSLKSQLPIGL